MPDIPGQPRGGTHPPPPLLRLLRGRVSPPRGFPLTPQRDFRVSIGGGFHGSFNPIPRPWESENYMVITTPEASRGGMCWVVLETLGYVGKVGAQDGVRGEFLRWNTLRQRDFRGWLGAHCDLSPMPAECLKTYNSICWPQEL